MAAVPNGQRHGAEKVWLHRFVKRCRRGDGVKIDHRNGDGLDCRQANLRDCTVAQNQMNRRKRSMITSSRFKGATRFAERRLWTAQLKAGGRRWFLGNWADEEDAALAYDVAAQIAFGEFASLNGV